MPFRLHQQHPPPVPAVAHRAIHESEDTSPRPTCRMPTTNNRTSSGPSESRQPNAAEAAARLRVLVAEDNQDAADTLRVLLEMSGYEVRVAPTGPAAIEAARQEPPAAIMCDIGLPGLDGYDVARTLRSDPRFSGVLMIAITGYGDARDRAAAKSAGFDHHFLKSTSPNLILEALRQFGSSRRRA
jgi:two-component system, sensor histidine kinase